MLNELRLFCHRNIYDADHTNHLFVKAMLKNVLHHQSHCKEYAQLLEQMKFEPNTISSIEDLYKIPPIPTLFFKRHTLYSTQKPLLFKSTTSGTSGTVSEVGLDYASAFKGLCMVLSTFFTHKLVSCLPVQYVILGYEPSKRNKLGVAKTAYATTLAAPALHREYALKDNGKDYELNIKGIKTALLAYEKSGRPVRFMGFPAYFMFLLKELNESGVKLQLHPKSLVMLAGGWKQFFTEQVDKQTLYNMAKDTLGIGGDRFQEFFGAVEHPIVYADCPNHHFHVPIYARVIIRDTNLQPVGYGVPGLLNLITPMITSMPFSSIMTDDLAIMYPGSQCGCGITTPYFEILGRVGLSHVKTCAAGAQDLMHTLQAELAKGGVK